MTAEPVGIATGIRRQGNQDRYMAQLTEHSHPRGALRSGRYASSYGRQEFVAEVTSKESARETLYEYEFDQARSGDDTPRADLLAELDLVVRAPDDARLSDLLLSVEMQAGGSILDGWYGGGHGDIETQMQVSNAVFGRRARRYGDLLVVPLTLAPFNRAQLWPATAAVYNPLVVRVASAVPDLEIQFWGRRYLLDRSSPPSVTTEFATTDIEPSERAAAPPSARAAADTAKERWARVWDDDGGGGGRRELKWVVHQHMNEMTADFKGAWSGGAYRQRLFLNHPTNLIAVWGFDAERIRRVSLEVDGRIYDSWTPAELEHAKSLRGWAVSPLIICLGDDELVGPPRSALNFSRCDRCCLVVDTTQQEPCRVHVMAVAAQAMVVVQGIAGMKFAK